MGFSFRRRKENKVLKKHGSNLANFESLNPYDVNDDGRKDYLILKDPEFSFEEYLEMQRMMNQFVTRKIWSGDEMLKKCEKNYEAFKEFWKISGLRGHFVLFDNPRH